MTDLETRIMSVMASARALAPSEIIEAIGENLSGRFSVVEALFALRKAGKVTRNEIGYWSRTDVGKVKP